MPEFIQSPPTPAPSTRGTPPSPAPLKAALDNPEDLLAVVRKCLDTDVRPYVQADGGDIELVSIAGRRVKVRMTGACVTCPSSDSTLREGVEARLRARVAPDLIVEEVK